MNASKFIVSYKYIDSKILDKKIIWSLNYLKKISSRYNIKIALNKKIINLKENIIFLFNDENILKKKISI